MTYDKLDLNNCEFDQDAYLKNNEYSKTFKRFEKIIITPFSQIQDELGIRIWADTSFIDEMGNCYEVAYSLSKEIKLFTYIEGVLRWPGQEDLKNYYETKKYQYNGTLHAWNYCPSIDKYFDIKRERQIYYYKWQVNFEEDEYYVVCKIPNKLLDNCRIPILRRNK